MKYRIQLAPSAAEAFSNLNPIIRRQLKVGFRELAGKPYAGKELQEDLVEFRSYRIKRYRIIFTVVAEEKILNI